MTDTTTTETTPADETETVEQPAETPTTEVDWKAEAEKWKNLSRQNENKAKANAEKAQQFDALEEANKTELQKAQERAAAAEQARQAAELRALVSETAARTGVPAELLHGSTQEELDLSAQAAIAWRGTQPKSPVGGADINGGAAKPTTYTRAQLADPDFYKAHRDDILAAQREGRIAG